jgi:hypothetical protein
MPASVSDLIHDLGADLRPVKRLRPPLVRALGWLAIVAATALVLAYFANLPGIAHRLEYVPDMWLAVLGSTLTTILGAVAAFELSLPDRKPAWVLLPVPGLLLWIAGTGMGCLRTWIIPGTQVATLEDARTCFTFIVSLSIPLSIIMVLMIRRACPLHPNLTALAAGLAVGAAAATLLNFFHPYDAGATDIAVHSMAIALVVVINRLVGGRLLTRTGFRAPM